MKKLLPMCLIVLIFPLACGGEPAGGMLETKQGQHKLGNVVGKGELPVGWETGALGTAPQKRGEVGERKV